jgi:hypothetical protein
MLPVFLVRVVSYFPASPMSARRYNASFPERFSSNDPTPPPFSALDGLSANCNALEQRRAEGIQKPPYEIQDEWRSAKVCNRESSLSTL